MPGRAKPLATAFFDNERNRSLECPKSPSAWPSAATDEQKAGMMRDITQALVKNLGVDADAVVIQINEAPLAHKMKGGKTFVERAAATKEVTRGVIHGRTWTSSRSA